MRGTRFAFVLRNESFQSASEHDDHALDHLWKSTSILTLFLQRSTYFHKFVTYGCNGSGSIEPFPVFFFTSTLIKRILFITTGDQLNQLVIPPALYLRASHRCTHSAGPAT